MVLMCIWLCMQVLWRPEKDMDPLEVELQVGESCLIRILEMELGSFHKGNTCS